MLREYQEEIHRLKSMLDGKDGDITGKKFGIGSIFHEPLDNVRKGPCPIFTQDRDEQATSWALGREEKGHIVTTESISDKTYFY